MAGVSDKPVLEVDSVEAWETWLSDDPDLQGVRLRLRKTASPRPGITYAQALDSALCFGWIDGQVAALDEDYHLRVFTPRRPRSVWSQRNRKHIARLTAAGRMRPAGHAEVERAKADGRWDAAYRQKDAPVPDDLQAALDASPAAAALFAKLTSQNRFAILFRIASVKRTATRAAKIATFIAMLERGETPHPQKTSPDGA
ncbi:MAG: YdeI/OmpD-associated family protein [Solirubrobacteraceae bacterium]